MSAEEHANHECGCNKSQCSCKDNCNCSDKNQCKKNCQGCEAK